jgi:hypothetical protein
MYRRIGMNILYPNGEQQAKLAAAATAQSTTMSFRNFSLNSPMIARVHNAKPGCSACGKKVM